MTTATISSILETEEDKAVSPVTLERVPFDTFVAEYVFRNGILDIHLFTNPGYLWKYEEEDVIKDVMAEHFGLDKNDDRLHVDFIPELYSWSIRIFGIGVVSPPSDELIVNAIEGLNGKVANASVDSR